VQTALTVAFCSWSIGGKAAWIPWSLFALTSTVWYAFAEALDARRAEGKLSTRDFLPLVPLAAYLVYSLIVFLNPSHQMTPGVGWTAREGWIPWLPTTFDRNTSLPHTLIHLAVLQQAGVLGFALRTRRARRLLAGLLLVNALLLTLAGAYFYAISATEMLGVLKMPAGYFFATFVYKNHWAAFSLLNAGLAAGIGFSAWTRADEEREASGLRLFAFAVFGLILFSIPLPGSRAGLLLELPLLLAVIAAAAWRLLHPARSNPEHRKLKVGLLLAGVALALAALSPLLMPSLESLKLKTEGQIQEGGGRVEAPISMRLLSAKDAFRMASDRPLWGWGPGSFLQVFPLYQGDYVYDRNHRLIGNFDAAHCDYAQFPAEQGWFGTLIFLIPALWCLWLSFTGGSTLLRWSAFGVVLVLICAIAEFPFQNPAVLLLTAVLLAMSNKVKGT